MTDELFAKALRYLVDCDGKTDKGIAKRFLARNVPDQFFRLFDAEKNTFVQTPYSMVYNYCTNYYASYNELPTDTTVRRELNNNVKLVQSVKESVLDALANIALYEPTINDFEYTIETLQNNWIRNSNINICLSALKRNANDPLKAIEFAQSELAKIHSEVTYSESANDQTLFLEQSLEHTLREWDEKGTLTDKPVQFGFIDWDNSLGGMFPGELIVIVGATGVGKTQLTRSIAYNAAFNLGLKVVVADREMLRKQNILRLLAYKTKIPTRKLRRPVLLNDEERVLVKTYMEETIKEHNNNFLMIPPIKCNNTLMITREIEQVYGNAKPDLILVDYLDELESSIRGQSGWEAMTQVAQDLKNLAIRFECPVLTISQFNAKGFGNADAGLAEMSWKNVAKKADGVITLVQDPDNPPIPPAPGEMTGTPGILIAKVAKYRSEATGNVFRMEAEFSTSSIRCVTPFKLKTKIGEVMESDEQTSEQSED